jgi:hypothetical protein
VRQHIGRERFPNDGHSIPEVTPQAGSQPMNAG